MRKNINLVLSVLFIIITGFETNRNNNVDGLSVKFRKVSEDYVIDTPTIIGNSKTIASNEMKFVKLKLTLRNESEKDCVFDFADVYISTEKDSLYRFLKFQAYLTSTAIKIKPHKEIDRIALFEFPDKAKPKELFIEDKRYTIAEEK